MSNKLFFSLLYVIVTVLFCIGGLYCGGYFFLKKVGIDPLLVTYDTLFNYYYAYSSVKKVMLMVNIGFFISIVVSLLPSFVAIFLFFALRKKEELYGSARFATDIEIKKRGLIDDD